ncbi:MAG: hypothetical protein CMJ85_13210 [Planctomycetes bacterium]|nr:hypothetical protein [Planctomycetota bacterium]MDP6424909.1 hypothetical protein [Planctomycetota bacterium]
MKRIIGSILFVVLLAWWGRGSLWSLGDELIRGGVRPLRDAVTMSEDARIKRELANRGRIEKKPHGYYWDMFTAMRAHVPSDGTVLLVLQSPEDPLHFVTTTHMTVLLFPRRFYAGGSVPPQWRATGQAIGDKLFVGWCGVKPDAALAPSFTERARSASFVLWQHEPK